MNESRRRIKEVIHEKKRKGKRTSSCKAPLDTRNIADVAQSTTTNIQQSDKKLEIRLQRRVKP